MSAEYESISLSSGFIQGFAVWYVMEPWPALALIQDYDVRGKRSAGETIDMDCENGAAKFEVVRRDEFGAYECKLLPGSTYEPPPKEIPK